MDGDLQPHRARGEQLPHDFPPWLTVFGSYKRWREDGAPAQRLHDALRDRVRHA